MISNCSLCCDLNFHNHWLTIHNQSLFLCQKCSWLQKVTGIGINSVFVHYLMNLLSGASSELLIQMQAVFFFLFYCTGVFLWFLVLFVKPLVEVDKMETVFWRNIQLSAGGADIDQVCLTTVQEKPCRRFPMGCKARCCFSFFIFFVLHFLLTVLAQQ